MLNKVIIMGRLTADPELRQTPSNVSTCSFTVACDRNYAPQGGEKQTDFISVVAWRQTAEFISRYFSKGSMIVVEGNLRTRNYNDKRYPEVRHYVTEVYADQVYFGESKRSADANSGSGFTVPEKPQVSAQQQDTAASLAIGNISEYEEIISDGELPF